MQYATMRTALRGLAGARLLRSHFSIRWRLRERQHEYRARQLRPARQIVASCPRWIARSFRHIGLVPVGLERLADDRRLHHLLRPARNSGTPRPRKWLQIAAGAIP